MDLTVTPLSDVIVPDQEADVAGDCAVRGPPAVLWAA